MSSAGKRAVRSRMFDGSRDVVAPAVRGVDGKLRLAADNVSYAWRAKPLSLRGGGKVIIACDKVMHRHQGGLAGINVLYGDGANANAFLGKVRPGEIGFDVMHYNLHKTFSTPHGGGGPGSGAVGVKAFLTAYLPGPIVARNDEDEYVWHMPAKSIGRVKAYFGNFGVLVRAYTYIRMHGAEGLRQVSENAVLNANYLQARLRATYPIPHGDRTCMHEFVAQGKLDGAPGIITMDIAKRLMDFGMHPPTVYFPLIVPEALMIEPTETESKETLDAFVAAMAKVMAEAEADPEWVKGAPHTLPARRLDDVKAARELDLAWK